ncbi:MAG: hypothetical protein ACKV19_29055 [Verrucomicrobiales bacterium]
MRRLDPAATTIADVIVATSGAPERVATTIDPLWMDVVVVDTEDDGLEMVNIDQIARFSFQPADRN